MAQNESTWKKSGEKNSSKPTLMYTTFCKDLMNSCNTKSKKHPARMQETSYKVKVWRKAVRLIGRKLNAIQSIIKPKSNLALIV